MSLAYKLLRYIAQSAVLYLLLRYLPYMNMSANKALITTIIIMVLSMILEQLCVSYLSTDKSPSLEGFSSAGNQTCACAVETFNGVGDKKTEESKPETGATGATEQTKPVETATQPAPDNGDILKGIDKMPAEKNLDDLPVKEKVNDDRFYWGTRYGEMGYDDRYGFGGMFYDEYPFYNRFRNHDFEYLQNTGDHIRNELGPDQARRDAEREENERLRMEERARSLDGYKSRYQEVGSKSERLKTTDNNRRIEKPIDYEIPYSDYNHLPVASGYKSHDYEVGYSYLPPEKWFNQPPRSPICVTSARCPVMPTYTDSTTADLKEFHSASRITPPDLISTDYINDKLNSGR